MSFAPIEHETIALSAAIESLTSLVNQNMFTISDLHEGESQIIFKSAIHHQLFVALLLDLLEPADSSLIGHIGTCLDALEAIARSPLLAMNGPSEPFLRPVITLKNWLAEKVTVETHLPSLSRTLDLTLSRLEFVYICGNISKHNFARLTRVARKVKELLGQHNIELTPVDAIDVLDDLYERFHDDILNYHSSTLVPLLNDIRWGIHTYLKPEYQRSYRKDPDDEIRYSYDMPPGIVHTIAQSCYWDLMNSVRRQPCVKPFRASRYLKYRY